MKIAISVIVTILLMTGFFRWVSEPPQEPTFTLFVSTKFIKELKEHDLKELNYLVGTNTKGKRVELQLEFADKNVAVEKDVAGIDNFKSTARTLFSHSSTCVSRPDLEAHEPISACIAGGWYNPIIHGGQNYNHCHCAIPWGNP